jgi:hypothetical protein
MIDVSKGEDVRLYKLADLIVRGWNFSFPISTLDFIGWYYAYPCNLFGLQCFAQLSTPFSRLSEFLTKIEVLPKRVTKIGTIPESLLRREKLFEHVLPTEPLLALARVMLDVLHVMMSRSTEGFLRGG